MKKSITRKNITWKIAVGLCAVTWCALSTLEAATFQWTNTASGDFLVAANWTNTASPFANGVPGTSDTGINNLPGSTTIITTGDAVTAGTIQAASGAISVNGGTLTATTVQATGSNGLFSVSGGTVSLGNLQITANYGNVAISGGATTVTTDSRIGAADCNWSVSGNGALNFSKFVIGSAAASNTNNFMVASGNAVVNQNQTGSTRELWVGGNNGGSGALTLENSAAWTNYNAAANIVFVGRGTGGSAVGTGVFNIQDNASFCYSNVVQIAGMGTGTIGAVNLNGGTMIVNGFALGTGVGTINANGGTIDPLISIASLFSGFSGAGGTNNDSVNLLSGGLTVNTSGNTIGINNVLSGAGGLTLLGGGTVMLGLTNTYTGATFVGNSTLVFSNSAPLASGAALTLSNSTLQFPVSGQLNTNFVTGTFSAPGATSTINISSFGGSGLLPLRFTIIKYATPGTGLVDGNNNLTNLQLVLPSGNGLAGYLTNNTAKNSIDVVITAGTVGPQVSSPNSISRYAGYTAQFIVQSQNATSYQWRTNGVIISDGGNIYGSTSNVLTITNVSAADQLNYDVVAANVAGTITSSVATLTIVTPDCNYEATIVSNTPAAYYRFNETGDPINTPNLPAYDYAGGFDAVYGGTVLNVTYGVYGPQPATGFPGFDSGNGAAEFTALPAYAATSLVTVSNGIPVVSTNTMTVITWVYPVSAETNFAGLFFNRGGASVVGLGYSGSTDVNGNFTLGYNWDNDANTYGWNSGLVPPQNQWSMVALVVTSTNATIYMGTTNGISAAVHTYAHPVQTLNGPVIIGDDTAGANGSRIFSGNMDEVSVFGTALNQGQITTILSAAVGTTNFPPFILQQPVSQSAVVGDAIQFSVGASGTLPLNYQWQAGNNGVFTNLTDGGQFSGSQTATLSINGVVVADATNYLVIVTNTSGSVTSSPASLTISASRSLVTLNASDASGSTSFNTAGNWSNASTPTFANDYLVSNSLLLRTPASGNAIFAGHSLYLTNNATLGFKTTGTITIGTNAVTGLFLDGAALGAYNASPSTLAGYVTLNAGGATMDPQVFSVLNLTATISGVGSLTVASPSSQYGGAVVLLSSNNYTGGTVIGATDTLKLSGAGTLGSINGSLTMNVTQGATAGANGTLDLNGTSQGVGNLSGTTNALILNSAVSTTNMLTIGNGNATGGNFQGSVTTSAGVIGLNKIGTGTITLSGANNYTGSTLINGGTLALSGAGTLSSTPSITLVSSAVLDVSGLTSPLSLVAGQVLSGSGATATINGSLNAGSGSLTLNYASGTPTLTVTGGTLTLNNNAVTVTNTGAALAVGSYKIVSKGTGGSVAGSVGSSVVAVAGSGAVAGQATSLSITGGELYLTVGANTPIVLTNSFNGSTLTLSWPGSGKLLQSTNVLGPWTTNTAAASPFSVTPAAPQMFYRIQQ